MAPNFTASYVRCVCICNSVFISGHVCVTGKTLSLSACRCRCDYRCHNGLTVLCARFPIARVSSDSRIPNFRRLIRLFTYSFVLGNIHMHSIQKHMKMWQYMVFEYIKLRACVTGAAAASKDWNIVFWHEISGRKCSKIKAYFELCTNNESRKHNKNCWKNS